MCARCARRSRVHYCGVLLRQGISREFPGCGVFGLVGATCESDGERRRARRVSALWGTSPRLGEEIRSLLSHATALDCTAAEPNHGLVGSHPQVLEPTFPSCCNGLLAYSTLCIFLREPFPVQRHHPETSSHPVRRADTQHRPFDSAERTTRFHI